jgi:ATP-dependent helicase/nuclease subunit A
VAVTFTRKAAREMRNRVRSDIGRYLAQPDLEPKEYGRWQAYQNGLDAARIGTIHNLCSEILRNHPAEAGVDPRFNVLDEVQSALLLRETVEATLAWAAAPATGTLSDHIGRLFDLFTERQLQELTRTMLYERPVMETLPDSLPAKDILDHWQQQLEETQAQALEQLIAHPAWQESLAVLRQNVPIDERDIQAEQREMVLASVSSAKA